MTSVSLFHAPASSSITGGDAARKQSQKLNAENSRVCSRGVLDALPDRKGRGVEGSVSIDAQEPAVDLRFASAAVAALTSSSKDVETSRIVYRGNAHPPGPDGIKSVFAFRYPRIEVPDIQGMDEKELNAHSNYTGPKGGNESRCVSTTYSPKIATEFALKAEPSGCLGHMKPGRETGFVAVIRKDKDELRSSSGKFVKREKELLAARIDPNEIIGLMTVNASR